MAPENNNQEYNNQTPLQLPVNSNIPMESTQMVQPNQTNTNKMADEVKTLGMLGLIFAFVMPVVGIVLSAIGLHKSKKIGVRNSMALVGLIVSIILTIVGTLMAVFMVFLFNTTMTYVQSGYFIVGSWSQTGSGFSSGSFDSANGADYIEFKNDKTMVWYHDKNNKDIDYATGTFEIEFGNKTNNKGQYALADDALIYTLTFKLKEYVDINGQAHDSSKEYTYLIIYGEKDASTFSIIGQEHLDSYTFTKKQ